MVKSILILLLQRNYIATLQSPATMCIFKYPFLIFYMPFLSHPLTFVRNLDTNIVYRNDKIIISEFFVFAAFYLDIQPVYSSIYYSVIGSLDDNNLHIYKIQCNGYSITMDN